MKKWIHAKTEISTEEYNLGKVDDLPYKLLLDGAKVLRLKDLEPYEGQLVYNLNTDGGYEEDFDGKRIRYKIYKLVPIKVKSFHHQEADNDGFWRIPEEYYMQGINLVNGESRYFSTKGISSYIFFDEANADIIIENAEAIHEEERYLNDRAKQVDQDMIRKAASVLDPEEKVVQTNAFSNGKAKVSIGKYSTGKNLTTYIHVSPTDGPFMNSSLYEIHYLPMTDGIVYRSYGAFGSAAGNKDWFRNASNNVIEITVDDMFDDIEDLQAIYDSISDGFSDSELSKQIHSRFRTRRKNKI